MKSCVYLENIRRLGERDLYAVLTMIALLFVGTAVRAQDALRIGYWIIPPHVVDVVNMKPKGTAIDYFEKYIAPHMGITITWDSGATPPTRLMYQLRNGQIDAMIFLGKTRERTEYLHYPDPYLDVPQTFAFRKDHPIDKITEASDLHGLKVGFFLEGRLPDELRDDRIKYDLIAGTLLFERNIQKLLADRIDAVYAPLTISLVNTIDKMKVGDQVKLVPIGFLERVGIFTVFSKKTVSKTLVEKYNKALGTAQEKQKYTDYIKISQ